MHIVAATACPTGIVRPSMAVACPAKTASRFGDTAAVEGRRAMIIEPPLSADDVPRADVAVKAAGIPGRERERCAGRPIVEISRPDASHGSEQAIRDLGV